MTEINETTENVVLDVHQMELHEFCVFHEINTLVLRVPGGWIYSHLANKSSLVFVPYSEEFDQPMKIPNF